MAHLNNLTKLVCLVALFIAIPIFGSSQKHQPPIQPFCRSIDLFLLAPANERDDHHHHHHHHQPLPIYILYDVNPAEGFNLRRDVYIRLAVFIKQLRKHSGYERATLVLPPFGRLYHWKSIAGAAASDQHQLFWNHFFRLSSLDAYTPVMDFWQYFDELRSMQRHRYKINDRIQLRNFENMFENGKFVDKFRIESAKNENFDSPFGYQNLSIYHHQMVQYQGSVMLLRQVIDQLKSRCEFASSVLKSVKLIYLFVDKRRPICIHCW